MTMAIGERWNDTVRLSCGEYGQPAASSDYAERVGTLSARKILSQRLDRGDIVHELTVKGAKHIGDGFLRTLTDVSQQHCIRNVSLIKKKWSSIHYAVQCVVLGEQAASAALEAEISRRAEAMDCDDDDGDDFDDAGGDDDDDPDDGNNHPSKVSSVSSSSAHTLAPAHEVQLAIPSLNYCNILNENASS
jgi:hypothetical protein